MHDPSAPSGPPDGAGGSGGATGAASDSGAAGERPVPGKSGNATDGIGRAVTLIEQIEREVPERYRVEVFRALFPAAEAPSKSAAPRVGGTPPDADSLADTGASWRGVDLGVYAPALAGGGRLLVKTLITLEVVADQLGVDWMTPAEIERFLLERARAAHVYRTNVSNTLRRARGLVDRRRRGRAYEYRITESGRAAVQRDLASLGRRRYE